MYARIFVTKHTATIAVAHAIGKQGDHKLSRRVFAQTVNDYINIYGLSHIDNHQEENETWIPDAEEIVEKYYR